MLQLDIQNKFKRKKFDLKIADAKEIVYKLHSIGLYATLAVGSRLIRIGKTAI